MTSRFASALLVLLLCYQVHAEPVVEREFKPVDRSWQVPFKIPEYILRTAFFPLQKLVEWEEEFFLSERVLDLISNEDRTIFLYPVVFYSSRDGFWFGLEYSHENFAFNDDQFGVGAQIRTNGDHFIETYYELEDDFHFFGTAEFFAEYRRNTNSRYYGQGPGSSSLNESIYELKGTTVHSEAFFDLNNASTFNMGFNLTFEHLETKRGNTSDGRPLAEDLFTSSELNGFGEELTFLNPGVSLTYDSRPEKAHPTNGGLVELSYMRGINLNDGKDFDYEAFTFKAVHLVEVEVTRRALAIGLNYKQVSFTAPFFRRAILDDEGPLRGYPTHRFNDERYLVGNLEYRYKIWESLVPENAYAIGTLFWDTGQVFDDFTEINSDNLQHSGGLGISIGVADHTLYRIQLALGGEGLSFIFAANQAF